MTVAHHKYTITDIQPIKKAEITVMGKVLRAKNEFSSVGFHPWLPEALQGIFVAF